MRRWKVEEEKEEEEESYRDRANASASASPSPSTLASPTFSLSLLARLPILLERLQTQAFKITGLRKCVSREPPAALVRVSKHTELDCLNYYYNGIGLLRSSISYIKPRSFALFHLPFSPPFETRRAKSLPMKKTRSLPFPPSPHFIYAYVFVACSLFIFDRSSLSKM